MRLIEPPAVALHAYDVAPDERILALTPVTGAGPAISLTVLVNWWAVFERRPTSSAAGVDGCRGRRTTGTRRDPER
jgi:hypothetical protein